MRVPLLPADITEPHEAVAAARARRGGTLLPIDRLLLHSPALAAGWSAHVGAMRTQTVVPARLRELVTVATSVLTGNDYEVTTHHPQFLAAGGTAAQFAALRDVDAASGDAAIFDETDRAALALTIEMCRSVEVSDATFARIRTAMADTRSLIELIAIIATYNMTNRVQRALDFR